MKTITLIIMSFFVASAVSCQTFDKAINDILPTGVSLGMVSADLKRLRSSVVDGPVATGVTVPSTKQFQILLEVEYGNNPSYTSYIYLFSHDVLTGVIQAGNRIGVSPTLTKSIALRIYNQLVGQIGVPARDVCIRKGVNAFVSVREDVWANTQSDITIFFIATDTEMTRGVFLATDIPVDTILIRPNASLYPLEDPGKETIHDIARP